MNLEELRRLAAKEEMSLNFIAKDEMLSKLLVILKGFDDLVLKGGTAVNRVYINKKRFSEDIDFDLIFKGSVKEALGRTKEIVSVIKGFEIQRPRIMHSTIRYDLIYTNPLGHKDKVRLEFRVTKKAGKYSKKIVNWGFVPGESSLLNVYDIEELIKSKIECVLDRLEGKDFLDLYYLMEIPHKHVKRINKDKLIERINLEEKEMKSVINAVNHYIPRNLRPADWTEFLEELKKKIEGY